MAGHRHELCLRLSQLSIEVLLLRVRLFELLLKLLDLLGSLPAGQFQCVPLARHLGDLGLRSLQTVAELPVKLCLRVLLDPRILYHALCLGGLGLQRLDLLRIDLDLCLRLQKPLLRGVGPRLQHLLLLLGGLPRLERLFVFPHKVLLFPLRALRGGIRLPQVGSELLHAVDGRLQARRRILLNGLRRRLPRTGANRRDRFRAGFGTDVRHRGENFLVRNERPRIPPVAIAVGVLSRPEFAELLLDPSDAIRSALLAVCDDRRLPCRVVSGDAVEDFGSEAELRHGGAIVTRLLGFLRLLDGHVGVHEKITGIGRRLRAQWLQRADEARRDEG